MSALQVLSDIEPDRPEEQWPSGVDVADDILFLLGMNVQLGGFDSPITKVGEIDRAAKKTLYTQVEHALNELVAYRLIDNVATASGPDTLEHMQLCLTDRGFKTLELFADVKSAAANLEQVAFRRSQLERMFRTSRQIDDERYGNRDLFSHLG